VSEWWRNVGVSLYSWLKKADLRVTPYLIINSQKVQSPFSKSIFWDWKRILLVDFMPKGITINAVRHSRSWEKIIKDKRWEIPTRGASLLHDYHESHTTRLTQELLVSLGCKLWLTHPTPRTWHHRFIIFLINVKDFLGRWRFSNDEEVQDGVENGFKRWSKR